MARLNIGKLSFCCILDTSFGEPRKMKLLIGSAAALVIFAIPSNASEAVIACLLQDKARTENKVFTIPDMKWLGKAGCPDNKKLLDGKTCNDQTTADPNIATWADVLSARDQGGGRYENSNMDKFRRFEVSEVCSKKSDVFGQIRYDKARCDYLIGEFKDAVATAFLNREGLTNPAVTIFPCEEISVLPKELQLDIYFNPITHLKRVRFECVGGTQPCFEAQTGYRPYGKGAPEDRIQNSSSSKPEKESIPNSTIKSILNGLF